MSSSAYATPLHIDIRASRILAFLLAVVHLGAAMNVVVLPWPVIARAGLVAMLISSGLYYGYRLFSGRYSREIVRLVWGEEDQWQLDFRHADAISATLMPGAYVHPWLIIVPLKVDTGRKVYIPLLPDMAHAEILRQLRVRLSAFHYRETQEKERRLPL